MFLHDAIVKALKEIKNPMTTTEIANVLNEKNGMKRKITIQLSQHIRFMAGPKTIHIYLI